MVAQAGVLRHAGHTREAFDAYLELIEGSEQACSRQGQYAEPILVGAQQLAHRVGDEARADELRELWIEVQPSEDIRVSCSPASRCGPDATWKTPGDRL